MTSNFNIFIVIDNWNSNEYDWITSNDQSDELAQEKLKNWMKYHSITSFSSIVLVIVNLNEDQISQRIQNINISPFSYIISDKYEASQFLHDNNITLLPIILIKSSNEITIMTIDMKTNVVIESIDSEFKKGIGFYNDFDLENAIHSFMKIIQFCQSQDLPIHLDSLYNIICIFHMSGYFSLTLPFIRLHLEIEPNNSTIHSLLWAIIQSPCISLSKQSCINIYIHLIEKFDNIISKVKLATITGKGDLNHQVNAEYAKNLYDNLAEVFENKLVNSLEYQAPSLFYEMILPFQHHNSSWKILDLGCGSGLVGRQFQDFINIRDGITTSIHETTSDFMIYLENRINKTEYLLGIEVSPKITSIAAKYGVYDAVCVDDLVEVLKELSISIKMTNLFNFIIASDTFIYIGALNNVFAYVSNILSQSSYGIFAFSIEDLDRSPMKSDNYNIIQYQETEESLRTNEPFTEPDILQGWGIQLLTSARYGHSQSYMNYLIQKHHFMILDKRQITLRLECTIPIIGILYVLKYNS